MLRLYSLIAALAALVAAPSTAVAATFDFTGLPGAPAASFAFSDGGVSGVITASDSLGVTNNEVVTFLSTGLGVRNSVFDTNTEIDGLGGGAESLLVTFDAPVSITSFSIGSIDAQDDYNWSTDTGLGAVNINDPIVTFAAGTVIRTLRISADAIADDVTLAGFTAHPVPVPAALSLLIGGLGALGLAARRRRAA